MSSSRITYRIYCYDAANKMLTADWIEAASDADAVARAHAMGFGSMCELWEGNRLVAKLEGERRQA